MSNPASEGALGALHELVAQALMQRIQDGALCTAADINAAIKFLKDNNITATREANKALGELEDELGKHSLPVVDDSELQAALDNIVHFPGSVANAGIS
ncbi:terminase subunit [Bacteriophage Titan-X]|uniref:Terminase subunit n=1 Tax=Bacteriophage Titan-X TaxID=2662140 RepID=A0A5Q2U9K6_9CAUD|nr:terminase subunit [Bacteriophage Titan-X]